MPLPETHRQAGFNYPDLDRHFMVDITVWLPGQYEIMHTKNVRGCNWLILLFGFYINICPHKIYIPVPHWLFRPWNMIVVRIPI